MAVLEVILVSNRLKIPLDGLLSCCCNCFVLRQDKLPIVVIKQLIRAKIVAYSGQDCEFYPTSMSLIKRSCSDFQCHFLKEPTIQTFKQNACLRGARSEFWSS